MTDVGNARHVSVTEGVLPRVRSSVVAAAATIKYWASAGRNNRGPSAGWFLSHLHADGYD